MKYAYLLLASFALASCSHVVTQQNQKLPDNFFDTVQDDFSLKYHVNKRASIPELDDICSDEPELGNLLKLPWRQDDPYVFLFALIDDLINEKSDYKILFHPLVTFVSRQINEKYEEFKMISYDEHLERRTFEESCERRLAQICAKKGHFDLVFNLLDYNPSELLKPITDVKNRKELMGFFKADPRLVKALKKILERISKHKNLATTIDSFFKRWVADCIIYDAPEEYYAEFASQSVLTQLTDILFLSVDIHSSEYPRIYAQIQKLLDNLRNESFNKEFEFYSLLNGIRFCPDAPQKLILSSFANDEVVVLAKAALIGNKQELFLNLCNSPMDQAYNILNEVLSMTNVTGDCLQAMSFKTIFELFTSGKSVTEFERISLDFTARFYAIDHLKLEDDRVIMEFIALKNLLDLDFPRVIRANMKYQPDIGLFIDSIFERMKVFNEATLTSFLTDYSRSSLFRKDHSVSIELIEFVSKSPSLLDQFQNLGIKLGLASTTENMKRFFNLSNYQSLTQIMKLDDPTYGQLITLSSEEQIKVFEGLSGTTVPEFFFKCAQVFEMQEFDYAEWHLALSYWIKSDQSKQIKNITSPVIKEMLRLEFPKETEGILDRD